MSSPDDGTGYPTENAEGNQLWHSRIPTLEDEIERDMYFIEREDFHIAMKHKERTA